MSDLNEFIDKILERAKDVSEPAEPENEVEQALKEALEDTTPERSGDPRRLKYDRKKDTSGWIIE